MISNHFIFCPPELLLVLDNCLNHANSKMKEKTDSYKIESDRLPKAAKRIAIFSKQV